MSWFVLIVSGMLEAVWAGALSASRGFTRRGPTVLFAVALVLSMLGLAWAMTGLPTGTAYAVWVGVGASLAVIYSFVTGQEAVSDLKILFLLMVVGGIVGLKVVS